MWEGWEKYTDYENHKSFGVMVKADTVVSLLTNLNKIINEPEIWEAEIVAFNPLAGEYVLYEDIFLDLEEAESKTWNKSQEIALSYYRSRPVYNSMGTAVPPPSTGERKTPDSLKWKGWEKVSDSTRRKRYIFRCETNGKHAVIDAALYLPNSDVLDISWIVILQTRILSEDNQCVIFSGAFSKFNEAEDNAWEEALKAEKAMAQQEDKHNG
jgi:hypothetical protein